MQLAPTIAQPPTAGVSNSPLLRILPFLRSAPIPAAAGASAANASPVPVAQAAPVEDASLAQKLLGNVGSKQQQYVANQQLLSMITKELGARISQVGAQTWSFLRGSSDAAG